jgi:hypothetical protein
MNCEPNKISSIKMEGHINCSLFKQLTLDAQEGWDVVCFEKLFIKKQENEGNTLDFLTTPIHSYNPL